MLVSWASRLGHFSRRNRPAQTQALLLYRFGISNCLKKLIISHADPRDVFVAGPSKEPVVVYVYSDASFEAGILRLGWVIFHPCLPTIGGSCAVPTATLASWAPRRQQIYPGETLCGLMVPVLHPDRFRNADVIWYIDNEAAASSLVRGSSKQLDVHMIAQYTDWVPTLGGNGSIFFQILPMA